MNDDQRRQQEQEQYLRMRPSLKTGPDGRPNPHHVPSPHTQSSIGGGGGRGGCFPAGTLVETPTGRRDISTVRAGDAITALDPGTGLTVVARVLKVHTHAQRRLWRLRFADGREVTTTSVHSFLVGGTWRRAGAIVAGDTVSMFDATKLTSSVVAGSAPAGEVANVYNLVVGDKFTFVADGAVVHSFTWFRSLRVCAWTMVGRWRAVAAAARQEAILSSNG